MFKRSRKKEQQPAGNQRRPAEGGYQPTSSLDTPPPQGGSGFLPKPKAKEITRSDLQVLMNEPVKLVIGTADNPRTVEIREPSNAQLGEYLAIINASMMKLLKDNVPLINAAVAGKDTSKIDFNMAALAEIMDLLVAKIVGEPIEYVQNEMSARQNAAIVRAFLDVLGWEFIKENFQQAMRAYQAAGSKKQNSAAPPWPHASSPKSAENTPN